MDKKERIEQLQKYIKSHDNNEYQFDSLYKKLLNEIRLELDFNSDLKTNHYLNNLRQTKEKQAEMYITIKRKRPKKGAPSEFKYFVNAFEQDVSEALLYLRSV